MRKAFGAALSAVVIAASAAGTGAIAAPRHNHGQQEQFMQNYCGSHQDSDCRDWNRHRDRWDDARYHSWYERHHHDHDFDAGDSAAALLGFAAGTAAGLITGAINGPEPACVHYRSYDRGSNTFMGRDGHRHECRL
jgi:hypothetical protein